MLLFFKLVDETKMYEPPEATKQHNSLKLLILLPVRANLICTLQCETPCIADVDRYKVTLSNFKQPENTQFS